MEENKKNDIMEAFMKKADKRNSCLRDTIADRIQEWAETKKIYPVEKGKRIDVECTEILLGSWKVTCNIEYESNKKVKKSKEIFDLGEMNISKEETFFDCVKSSMSLI